MPFTRCTTVNTLFALFALQERKTKFFFLPTSSCVLFQLAKLGSSTWGLGPSVMI